MCHWWTPKCSSIDRQIIRLEFGGSEGVVDRRRVGGPEPVCARASVGQFGGTRRRVVVCRKHCVHSFVNVNNEQSQPGPDGLFPGVVQGLTEAAQDRDVHIHECLRGQVPLGISTKIPPGGVFPMVSPQSVGRERDRIRYLHAKVWRTENYASYAEHKAKADGVLKNDIAKWYVQWAVNRQEIEQDVGTLELAKIAVVVKGEKVRLTHDMRRNGTNSKVTFEERLVLPRVKDIEGVMELLGRKKNNEGVEFRTLDFRDAFKQLHVVPSERRFLTGAAMGGFFSGRYCLVWDLAYSCAVEWQLGSCAAPKRG